MTTNLSIKFIYKELIKNKLKKRNLIIGYFILRNLK